MTIDLASDLDPSGSTGATPVGAVSARRRRRLRIAVMLVGIPVLVGVVAVLAFFQFRPHIYAGTVLQAPDVAPPMDGLVYGDGSEVDLTAFQGDVVLVYFGYTHCPDVCPSTLVKTVNAIERMGDDGDRVHVMMVSVDPERDTPEVVARYVEAFRPDYLGATGAPADVDRVAATYGIFAGRGEDLPGDDYAVDHTASLIGIDTDGHLRIIWPTDVTVEALADDLAALL